MIGKTNGRFWLAATFVAICVAAVLRQQSLPQDLARRVTANSIIPAKRIAIDLKGKSRPVAVQRADRQSMSPVSMTRIDENLFLVANYRNIYAFDAEQNEAYPLKLDTPPAIWAPTAVHYSAYYDRLFIANYTGNDIIIAAIDRSGPHIALRFQGRLVDEPGIHEAEGIDVSAGGRYMAVANWGGDSVSLFERVTDRWVLRWQRPMLAAHGVSIVGSRVFASGKEIAKFDIATGNELGRIDQIDGRKIQFTTCLNYDNQTDGLIASDAIRGDVFTLTLDLAVKEVFGANGPTFDNLSMPYCVYRDRKATYILSTYQERIIRIDATGTTSFEFGKSNWATLPLMPEQTLQRDVWDGYLKTDSPSFAFFDTTIRSTYGGVLGDDGTQFMMPTRTGALSFGWLFYAVSVAKDGDWLMLTSNSATGVILFNQATKQIGSADLHEQDCWAMSDRIVCPSGQYDLSRLFEHATVIAPGSLGKVAKSLDIKPNTLLDELTSRGGLILKNDLTRSAALAYLKWAKGRTVPFMEYWIAWGIAYCDDQLLSAAMPQESRMPVRPSAFTLTADPAWPEASPSPAQ